MRFTQKAAALFALGLFGQLSSHAGTILNPPALDPAHPIVGTLQCDTARMDVLSEAGARGVVVGISWDRCEREEGKFDSAYLKGIKDKIDLFRTHGKFVVVDLGVQYPPSWIFLTPSSHFINQNGVPFDPVPGMGDCGVNLVYSEEMREKFEVYAAHVLHELGNNIDAVRLGGGRYGELGYPINKYKDSTNCYWAFDPIAQGSQPGLPPGGKPCPVPGWIPGATSPNHESARQFLDWYMESMKNYHDWQISMVRKYFSGPLFMLYPSIGGLRPGQLTDAINNDANGSTQAEKTGEVGRGFDMARYVAGIEDTQVIVYSTWIDGFEGSDDLSMDPKHWSPGHFLASLASAHVPPLLVGGENTGHPDDVADMEKTFQRMRNDHLCVMFWAFEPTLFDGKNHHADVEDFKKFILADEPDVKE